MDQQTINDPFQSAAGSGSTSIVDPFAGASSGASTPLPGDQAAPQLKRGYSLTDIPKALIGGLAHGVGSAISGVGELADLANPANAAAATATALGHPEAAAAIPNLVRHPLTAAADALATPFNKIGDVVQGSESDAAKQAEAQPLVSGNLLQPSTWSLGAAATSPEALAQKGAGLLGNIAPMFLAPEAAGAKVLARAGEAAPEIGAALKAGDLSTLSPEAQQAAQATLTRAGKAKQITGATVGGVQMAAGQAQGEQDRIEQMTPADLEKLPGYQQLLARGMDPDAARQTLADQTRQNVFAASLPLAVASAGVSTLPLVNDTQGVLARAVGQSSLRRAALGAGLESPTQGASFVAQNAASIGAANATTGENRSPLDDSLGSFASGALMGGAFGLAGGLHDPYPGAPTGTLSDAANTLHRTAPAPAEAPSGANPESAAPSAAPEPNPVQAQPTSSKPIAPPAVPWIDGQTGELLRNPTDNDLIAAIHGLRDQQQAAVADGQPKPGINSRQLASAWGVTQLRLNNLRADADAERAQGFTTDQARDRARQEQTVAGAGWDSLNQDQQFAMSAFLAHEPPPGGVETPEFQEARAKAQRLGIDDPEAMAAQLRPPEPATPASTPTTGDLLGTVGETPDLLARPEATAAQRARIAQRIRGGGVAPGVIDAAAADATAGVSRENADEVPTAPSDQAAGAGSPAGGTGVADDQARAGGEAAPAAPEPPAPSAATSEPAAPAAAEAGKSSSSLPSKSGNVAETTANVDDIQGKEAEQPNGAGAEEATAQQAAVDAAKAKDPELAAPTQPTRVDATKAVPLGAGLSEDGSTLYVDPHIPPVLPVERPDGSVAQVRLYDPANPKVGGLVVHEGIEHAQMKKRGKTYQAAHDENANVAEDAYYQTKYGVSREAVDKALKPHLDAARKGGGDASTIPADLDRQPYEDSNTAHLLGEQPPASPAVATAAGAEPTYNEAEEQQEGDITPTSGSPFTIRAAADREAARHPGGKVFQVYGGFVVRTPEPEEARESAAPKPGVQAAALESAAHPENPRHEPTPAKPETAAKPLRRGGLTTSGAMARVVKGKLQYTAAKETLEAYFKHGSIVKGYGQIRDKVLAFDWAGRGKPGEWSVRVQEVDKDGDPIGHVRQHWTMPSPRDLEKVLGKPELATKTTQTPAKGGVSAPEEAHAAGSSAVEPVRGVGEAEAGDTAGKDQAVAAKPSEKTVANTKDAGEELWANRRNSTGKGLQWSDIKDLNATLRAREAVKSKVWPRPDYEKLIKEGLPPIVARLIKHVYDGIAVAPKSRAALKEGDYQQYVDGVNKLRDEVFAWARELTDRGFHTSIYSETAAGQARRVLALGREGHPLLDALFPDTSGSHNRFSRGESAQANNSLALLLGGNKLVRALQLGGVAVDEAKADLAKGWPMPQEAWQKSFHVAQATHHNTGDPAADKTLWYVFKKGRPFPTITDSFTTREKAIEAAKQLYSSRGAQGGDGSKPEPLVKLADARQGVAHRGAGEDVDSDRLKNTFGFRGVNFGNWMKGDGAANASERQAHLNHAYDSLMDLANILGVPPRALSLDGKLGIAFGAQGSGGKQAAAAHFVPGVNEINLTRGHGAGSLAHEWAHALDHYFATQAGDRVATSKEPFLTEHLSGAATGELRPEIRDAFKTIVDAMSKRPETQQEAANRIQRMTEGTRRGLDGELSLMRNDLSTNLKNGEDRAARLEEFDQLAGRLRRGDIGEGYLKTGNGRTDAQVQVVGQLANLYKDATGKKARHIEGLGSYARAQARLLSDKAENAQHASGTMTSEYAKQARLLEGSRKKPYWTTKLEMFARAFQSYVIDKLAQKDAFNHYLSRPQMSEEQIAKLREAGLAERGDRYPRGVERERIDGAFDTLIGSLKHEETPEGNVRLFSKAHPGQSVRFEPDAQLSRRMAQFVDEVGAGKVRPTDTYILGQTPDVLVEAGAPNIGLEMEGDAAIKLLHGKHSDAGINPGQLKSLPQKLADPLAVFESKTHPGEMVVLTDLVDKRGRGVIAAVHLNKQSGRGVVNRIETIHPRDNAEFESWAKNGLLRYHNDEAPALPTTGPLQLGKVVQAAQGLNERVLSKSELRNRATGGFRKGSESDSGAAKIGIARDRVDQVVRDTTAKWGADQPQVHVVDSPEELPQGAKKDPDYARAQGLYDGKTVFLVRSALKDEADVHRVLAHEAIGHYGIDRVVGQKDWANITSSIRRLDKEGLGSAAMKDVLASVNLRYPGADDTTFAKEALAVMAERGIRNGIMDRVVAAMRAYLRKIMPNMRFSEAELRQMLVKSDQFLRTGEKYSDRVARVAAMSFSNREDQTLTDTFKKWFGKSKVVTDKGRPLMVYHGTGQDFSIFKHDRAGESTGHSTSPLGHHFTENLGRAQHYAENASEGRPANERVVDAHLAIEHPYKMTLRHAHAIDTPEQARTLRDRLEAQGYDGIHQPESRTWIAFKPEQIKSASENRGTFDRSNPDIRFSKAADDSHETLAKPAASMDNLHEVLTKGNEPVLQQVRDWVRGKAEDFRPAALGMLQTRHLLELMESHPALKGSKLYARDMQQLGADRHQMMVGAEDAEEHPANMLKRGVAPIADAWRKIRYAKGLAGWVGRERKGARAMDSVMHDATVYGIDPSEDYAPLTVENARGEHTPLTPKAVRDQIKVVRGQMKLMPGEDKSMLIDEVKRLRGLPARENLRKQRWPQLVARYQALSPEAKDLYKNVRDWYAQHRDATEEALIKNIEAYNVPETYRRSLVNRMRLRFEEARREGVYFPLNRNGDYWTAFTDKEGREGFLMHEDAKNAAAAEKKLRDSGFTINAQGRRDGAYRAKDAPSGTFVRDIIDTLRKAGASEKVQDEVYQMFLKSLPEMSMRTHSIHRRNVPGFDEDAMRAFAKNGFHGAHQLARLRHSQDMQNTIEALQASVDSYRRGGDQIKDKYGDSTTPSALETARADALLAELKKRNDWIMAPKDTQLANHVNSIAFLYYLGASPASAITYLTQGAQITLPFLGAEHGFPKAARVLGGAYKDGLRTFGNILRTLTDPEERRAYHTLSARGDFTKTQAHTLAGLAEGDALRSSPLWSRPMQAVSYMFHTADLINRQATGVAAFRLARSAGKDFNTAVQYASDIINGTHFDYSAANRARLLQGNTARIITQFKQYSIGMTWALYRNLEQSMKGETPQIRRVARRTVTGILGMTSLLAGTMGLPIYNAVKYTANAANALFGNNNEPYDFDTEYRDWLAEHFGADAANWIADGPTNQITGANVAGRTSLSDEWFRDPDRELEGKDAYYNLLEAIAGPIGGMTKNFFVGSHEVSQGNIERGMETMMPTSVRNGMKALRYATQGVNSLRGDPIVPDVNVPEDMLQVLGFQPTKVAEQQRINNALENYQQFVQQRRQTLMNAYAMAAHAGAGQDIGAALDQIRDFNAQYPQIAINAKTLRQSMRTRARYSAQAQSGIFINPKLQAAAREYVGQDQQPAPTP